MLRRTDGSTITSDLTNIRVLSRLEPYAGAGSLIRHCSQLLLTQAALVKSKALIKGVP